jgi:hypothetical protein
MRRRIEEAGFYARSFFMALTIVGCLSAVAIPAYAARHHNQTGLFQQQLNNSQEPQTAGNQVQTAAAGNIGTSNTSGNGLGSFQSMFQNILQQLEQIIQQLVQQIQQILQQIGQQQNGRLA